jgi:hypothetical protein
MARPTPSVLPQLLGASVVVSAFAGGGALLFAGPSSAPPATYAALILDASVTSRAADRCEDAVGVARGIAERARGPVELTIYATGSSKSDGQSVRLGRASRASQPRLAEVHADAGPDRAFLSEVRALCEAIQPQKESPLFAALVVAVDDLVAAPCSEPRVDCAVWFRTDGLEEVDELVTAALTEDVPDRQPRIDNEDVDVVFCGLAARQVRGRKGSAGDLSAVDRAFRPELSRPDRARLLPNCPVAD